MGGRTETGAYWRSSRTMQVVFFQIQAEQIPEGKHRAAANENGGARSLYATPDGREAWNSRRRKAQKP